MFKGNDVYIAQGYENREDYLDCLSREYEVDLETVSSLADILGPSEDFDGLVTSIQDYAVGR